MATDNRENRRAELKEKWHPFNRGGGHGFNLVTKQEYEIPLQTPTEEEIEEMISVFSSPNADYYFLETVFADIEENPTENIVSSFYESVLSSGDVCQNADLLSYMAHFAWTNRDRLGIKEEWLKEIYKLVFTNKENIHESWKFLKYFAEYARWNDTPSSFCLKNVFASYYCEDDVAWLTEYMPYNMHYVRKRVEAKPFTSEKDFLKWKIDFDGAYRDRHNGISLEKIIKDVTALQKLGEQTKDPKDIAVAFLKNELRNIIMLRDVLEKPTQDMNEVCERMLYSNLSIREVQNDIDEITGYKFCRQILFGSDLCRGKFIFPWKRPCFGYTMYSVLTGH